MKTTRTQQSSQHSNQEATVSAAPGDTNGGYLFGRVRFTKRIDDVDWRVMEKAFAEIQARLPIKIVVHPETAKVVEQRKLKRYEATKEHHQRIELKPDLWDLGKEANAMYDTVRPSTVEENPALG
jgi:dihydroorotase-like cyclic amidohydrolase